MLDYLYRVRVEVKEMVTAETILYSQSATQRLFGSGAKLLSVFKKVVLVWIKGFRPRFVSKSVFKEHFNQRRIDEAKKLEVAEVQDFYAVKNEAKGTFYVVTPLSNSEFVCNCEDYKNQITFWGKGRCKHIHAVRMREGIA